MRAKTRPTIVEVRRTARTCTYLWDSPPWLFEQRLAERADPPRRPRFGHSWPGDDQTHATVLISQEIF